MLITANELAEEIELRADRQSAHGSPGYEDFDLTSVLTEAEWQYVKEFGDRLSNRKMRGFEETEIRNQGLSALVCNEDANLSATQTGVHSFAGIQGYFFDLPDNFMYTIHEVVEIDKNNCSTEQPIIADVRNVSHKEIMRFRKNLYKKPYYNTCEAEVWRQQYKREDDGHLDINNRTAKRHQIITDGTFQVAKYSLSYMQKPKGIIVDRNTPTNQRNSILDDSVKEVLITMAVENLMERVREQKVNNNTPSSSLE